jgi:hypothetical protein
MMRNAQASDWNTQPLPEKFVEVKLDIKLNIKQSEAVIQGFIPEEMEEKWFCYFENNILYQYRSWTGFCIDEIYFVAEGRELRAVSAKINREPEQYLNTDITEDIDRITSMLVPWR